MKSRKIIFLSFIIGLTACQSAEHSAHQQDSTEYITSGKQSDVDAAFLVVPGKSIGEILLGENMTEVGKKLGRPDAGDAAMGKAWGIWYSKDSTDGQKNELAVYSSYRDTSMMVKEVKQIRITSAQFKTQNGITTGGPEADAKSKFPAMELVSSYLNQNKDTVTIYDSRQDGIGFEFLKGKSISITVHPVNQSVNGTYLTLHPEWKLIE
ncbi:hypothetical protein EA772_13005 [Pedobacter sp. G11]|uniref:hypothetical protein n=1 Tax=Pedobacter sp. G11 TaxID=2482728 RepID=UPI000F5EA295|nr:hypothetical protein [Pedobacter sp. G11]AZI26217.1 hypothetical protein EA772_13005 [Pedobacter sp. G11]